MPDVIMSEDDESAGGFFCKRAKLVPKKSAEELQAAAELLAKIEAENSEIPVKPVKKTVLPKIRTKRNFKKNDQTPPEEEKKDDIKQNDSFTEVSLSSASKRRIRKLENEQLRELERIDAENEKILSSFDVNLNHASEAEISEDFQKMLGLTIMYMSKISRLKCFENDKFVNIFPKIAELFNLKVTEFLLCLDTKNITIDDTPKDLGITDKDILECIPYKSDEKSKPDEDTGNTFKISFQSNDAKEKIELVIHKMEKMEESMKRYSEQRNIPLNRLLFSFDGEKISGDETPAELDLESESCVDVTVLDSPPIVELNMEAESSGAVTALDSPPTVELDMESESSGDVTVLGPTQKVRRSPRKACKPSQKARKSPRKACKKKGQGKKITPECITL